LIPLCAATSGCTATPRDLTWEIVFAEGVDAARAVRVETRILAGGCDGTTELYVANVDPSSPDGAVPSILSPGRYGFAATAWSADCVPYAEDCSNHTLPAAEDEAVLLELSDAMASAACPAARCVSGTCQDMMVDGGMDADAMPDADADADAPPPGPLNIGQGLPAATSQMIDLTGDAVIIASGTSSFNQRGGAGGWVSSRLFIDGLMLGGTVTTRRGLNGNELHAGSSLIAPVSGDPFVLSHARDEANYDFVSERWAWGAISASEVVFDQRRGAEVAELSVTTTDDVIAIVNGVTGAIPTRTGAGISMALDVDGIPCGRSTQDDDNDFSVPGIGASFLCLTALGPGAHTLGARATATNVGEIGTEIDYVLVPRDRVTPFGTSSGSASVDLPGAGVLVAFAWHRFTGTGGWGEVALRVDGSNCARSRTETAPSDLTIGCVWPVAGSATVNLEAIGSGEGTTPTTATLGWAFLSSAAP